jgi:hypothetical protein
MSRKKTADPKRIALLDRLGGRSRRMMRKFLDWGQNPIPLSSFGGFPL